MTPAERERYLADVHVGVIAVERPERAPLAVPIWYQYRPGGQPWVLTGADSRKHRLIEAAGCFSLMVERSEPTVRYVAVDGPVSRIEPATDEPPGRGPSRALQNVGNRLA